MQAVKEALKQELPNKIAIPNDPPEHPSEQAKLVNELEQPKKTPQDNLSSAEKRRYEEIVTIQHYLSQGYSPSQIRELMHTSYNRIRRYARGDPLNLCHFTRPWNLQIAKYQVSILGYLRQNMMRKAILAQIIAEGYTGKRTALYDYCNKLIEEYQIAYTPKKNIRGVVIKANQAANKHYLTRQDILKNLWSGKEVPQDDLNYLSVSV